MNDETVNATDRAEVWDAVSHAVAAFERHEGDIDQSIAAALVQFHERMELYGWRKSNEFMATDHQNMARMISAVTAHDRFS